MATTYDEIYDLALVTLRDYNLDDLYASSPTNFKAYFKGFLIRAIPKFTNCQQDLSDRNDTTSTFNITLTDKEKDILASLTNITWVQKEIKDITQMNLHMNDTDFRHFSEAQNLDAKRKLWVHEREIVNQDMTDYGLSNVDWSAWGNGEFGV